jgi:hypothetical protein
VFVSVAPPAVKTSLASNRAATASSGTLVNGADAAATSTILAYFVKKLVALDTWENCTALGITSGKRAIC